MTKLDNTLSWLAFFVSIYLAAWLTDMPGDMFLRFMATWFGILLGAGAVIAFALIMGYWYMDKIRKWK